MGFDCNLIGNSGPMGLWAYGASWGRGSFQGTLAQEEAPVREIFCLSPNPTSPCSLSQWCRRRLMIFKGVARVGVRRLA